MKEHGRKFFLKEGYLWHYPKKLGGNLVQVVGSDECRQQIITSFHEIECWASRHMWYLLQNKREILVE
jgi:hypothetical protein